jgi:L-threonylcarbamoyladenylate synthase
MAIIGTNISIAKQLLEQSQVLGIPTETVYGLAGNCFDIEAVSKIFEVKNRPTFDPLIVHIGSVADLPKVVKTIPVKAQLLADAFMPGPLTLLLPKHDHIPDLVTAGMDTVAVRVPNHRLILSLLQSLDFPLAAPSANPFGYISPTSAQHVAAQLGDKIPYILDGGLCGVGIESTIVGFENDQVIIYRKGGLAIEAIQSIIGPVSIQAHSSSNPKAPGMLKSHYAPRKPLFIYDDQSEANFTNKTAFLGFDAYHPNITQNLQMILSFSGDFQEAAQNLFAMMRRLDELDVDQIFVELLPEKDLGRAINDRLRRASAR